MIKLTDSSGAAIYVATAAIDLINATRRGLRAPVADERQDDIAAGLQDSAYCAGLQRGFVLGNHNDNDGLRRALESRDGYVKTIKDASAALASAPVPKPKRAPLDDWRVQAIAECLEAEWDDMTPASAEADARLIVGYLIAHEKESEEIEARHAAEPVDPVVQAVRNLRASAPVADEPVPYPKREDVTPEMRASFERLFSEARKHNHGTLARNEQGAYRDLRVDADWVFYQRAWADALASAPVPHCAGPNCKALDDDTGPPHSPECRAAHPAVRLGWRVRERRSDDGKLLDCFVEAPAAPGMAYAQEVLGDDYAEAQGGIEGKLKHCQMIVAWANAAPQASAEAFDFAAHLARQAEFSALTFGPGARVAGVSDHIRKELIEVETSGGDLKEWVDVIILGLDGAWRSGATPQEIIAAIVAKQAKNEARTWPDWRTMDPDKAIEHQRTAAPCSCPGGDGSLRHPCAEHPPKDSQ